MSTEPSKILIVDDDPQEQQLLEFILKRSDYALHFAADGARAVQLAHEIMPDLVLLDVMMPKLDGFETCRQLRADPVLAEVPIVLITALGDRNSFLTGMEAGADDFITKPFDSLMLKTRLQTITRLNRYRGLLQERTKLQWVVEETAEGYLSLSDNFHVVYANTQAKILLEMPAKTDTVQFFEQTQTTFRLYPDSYWKVFPAPPEGMIGYLVRSEQSGAKAVWLQVDLLKIPPRAGEMYFLRLRDVTSAFQENRLRWSFHDIVSHKFQTPLALLEGFLEILQDPTLDDVRRKVLIEESLKSTRLLQGEVDAIFRYLQAPDLADLGDNVSLGKVVQIFRNICVRLEMPASYILNPYPENIIIGLPMQAIETILRELVQNAIKFHPQQKPKMQLEIICHENEIVLQVADNGLGLPASELDRIWTPYFQVDDGFSGEQPGMGLGLSMIAMIVLSAGGRCRSFNRTDGTGLVVELQLPLANKG